MILTVLTGYASTPVGRYFPTGLLNDYNHCDLDDKQGLSYERPCSAPNPAEDSRVTIIPVWLIVKEALRSGSIKVGEVVPVMAHMVEKEWYSLGFAQRTSSELPQDGVTLSRSSFDGLLCQLHHTYQ